MAEDVVSAKLIDSIVPINGNDALRLSRELATREGIFVGISGGATLAGAIAVAEKAQPGSNVLCMLPDTGERYLSTPLFDDIPADMTEEEKAIDRLSTPNCLTNAMVNRPCMMVCLGFLIMFIITVFVIAMDWMTPNNPNDRDFMVWGNPWTNDMDKTILV